MHLRLKTISTLAAALCVAAAAQAAPYYYVTDLGDINGANYVVTAGMNNNGDVVGYAKTSSLTRYYAFLYTDGKMYDLGVLPGGGGTNNGTYSKATSINDNGQITGFSRNTTSTSPVEAFLYAGWSVEEGSLVGGTMAPLGYLTIYDELGNPTTGTSSYGYGINDDGDVVGYSVVGANRGFLKPYGQAMENIGDLGGATQTSGQAISNNGKIAGQSNNGAGAIHAFLQNPGEDPIDLGSLGGTMSYGNAVNDNGQVAGKAQNASAVYRAFIYNNAEEGMVEIAPLAEGTSNEALGINEAGDVVGNSYLVSASGTRHAFLCSDGTVYDLNSRVDPSLGWTISYATDINDNGQICGYGTYGGTANSGFILDPAIMGDADLNRTVNNDDLFTLLSNLGSSDATWLDGDFDDNGTVNNDDLFALLGNLGENYNETSMSMLKSAGISLNNVPEPSMLALLVCGLASAAFFAWRKRR